MIDTEQKALALVQDCVGSAIWKDPITRINRKRDLLHEALCRAIEQHETDIADLQAEYDEVCKLFEAFRQEVSDALSVYQKADGVEERSRIWDALTRFIIAKPDPLVEALNDMKDGRAGPTTESYAACLRAAIEKRGGKITWGEK